MDGNGGFTRTGATALSLLAAPLHVNILGTLEKGGKTLIDLRQAVDSPPESTMRLYSRILKEHGAIERQRRLEFPAVADYEITLAGRELLQVGAILEEWLQAAPNGPARLGSTAAKSATKALVEGWSTGIVRVLATVPLTLTEMSRLMSTVSYPSLERRLKSMRLVGLVEPKPNGRRGTPYALSEWARRAVVPLVAAIRWERKHRPQDAQPIRQLDAQAAFLLAMPLLDMAPDFNGRFRLAVELGGNGTPVLAGVQTTFADGKVVSYSARLKGEVDTRVTGTPAAWLGRMNGFGSANARHLTLGITGDIPMAESLLDSLHAIAPAPATALA